ncbi:pyrokinin-1 receptor-like [Trichogramma pretiosum]|uniref:pyrokinin-1 receptor-like n=1 Tax=Trichogramma pretiosum TaxID=7493 RepID=UPI0006C9D154|nr:pyrokinin-1 receptor-like [Trichogramma pretiosum]
MDIHDDVKIESTTTLLQLRRDPLYIVVPVSVAYCVIFFAGLLGNVSTCLVIAKNKAMHTSTNYYLFSLAISDLLLLVSGLPPEIYYMWSNYPYVFGEAFCILQSFAAETAANATVLTITAFSVERYVAICHPFLSHAISNLKRAIRYVIAVWTLALVLAIPQAVQFGLVYQRHEDGSIVAESAICSLKWTFLDHAFEVSTFLLFVVPMIVITVLYILIGVKLRRTSMSMTGTRDDKVEHRYYSVDRGDGRKRCSQKNITRMLVAVVITFFICWAPFHAQRLLAIYAKNYNVKSSEPTIVLPVYRSLTYISGVLYYLSTAINPLLYNIMSNKFRKAFMLMFSKKCRAQVQRNSSNRPQFSIKNYSPYPNGSSNNQQKEACVTMSLSLSDETVPKTTICGQYTMQNDNITPSSYQTTLDR